LQEELFPLLQTVMGALSRQMELLTSVVALAPLERIAVGATLGRRPSRKGLGLHGQSKL
jgi:hypothetical protein